MNKQNILFFYTAGILMANGLVWNSLYTQPSIIEPVIEEQIDTKKSDVAESSKESQEQKATEPKKIVIRFEDENLVDVIDYIAKQKGANIILPVGDKTITSKVTIRLEEKFTVDGAWDFLYTLLQMSGYNMVPRGDNMFAVLKVNNAAQEPLPLYVGVNYEDLPDTDEPIRALFYFGNVKLSEESANTFNMLLTQLLPPEQRNGSGTAVSKFAIDPLANALVIAERARTIKAVMKIVSHLERTEFKEKYEVISLLHTSAEDVAKLFNETILKTAEPFPMGGPRKPVDSTYFSKYVRIVPENRLNILLILGREQAVDRVVDFIKTYIDVAPETGKSILHIYKLRYLDAKEFSEILTKIVELDAEGQTGQTRIAAGQSSIERYFEGPPRILSDLPATATTEGEALSPQFFGGNNLIIAARNDDWAKLRKLIEELDTPQPQIILEVLVADLTQDDAKKVATALRNPTNVPLPNGVETQSAQINGVITNDPTAPKTVGLYPADSTHDADILNPTAFDADCNPAALGSAGSNSLASCAAAGTALLSLADPITNKTWALMEILKSLSTKKVISSPHIVAVNNKPARIVIGQQRLLQDATSSGVGGSGTVISKKWIEASLEIIITPRISISDVDMFDDRVQLSISVSINDFDDTTDISNGNMVSRSVKTTALLRSQEVLPLGGLLRLDTTDNVTEVPLLGRIPLIGYLFKNRNSTLSKTNLTVFLCPTIIRPRFRWGSDQVTRDYIKLSKQYSQEGKMFESLKDPITHWFFTNDVDASGVLDDFEQMDEMKRDDATRIFEKEKTAVKQETAAIPDLQMSDKSLKELLAKVDNPLLRM